MAQAAILIHQLDGAIVAYDAKTLPKGVLIAGPDAASIVRQMLSDGLSDGARQIAQGALTLRLGVALYDRPFIFTPGFVIDEMGRTIEGEVVFDWLRLNAYDMPRSEVFGIDARGREDQVFARDVDVEAGPIVIGGPDGAPVFVAAVIGQVALPPRFTLALRALPGFAWTDIRKLIDAA